MPQGSPQFTPKQLLDAGRRAESEGRLDLAHQFYGHLNDHYGQTSEAAEGRHALARIGAASHHPQVWQMNGSAPSLATNGRLAVAPAPRARRVAQRTEYRVGRALAALASGIGWLAMVTALLVLAVGVSRGICPHPRFAGAQARLQCPAAGGGRTAGGGRDRALGPGRPGAVRSGERDA